ncbi:uncharacterized protein LOC130635989 isoform X1 [Hydractinia symbiolongicarpus]|uniref:uncharacterized protein LOC130635989 isoform X1 n=1 Tax=Hydractinia symbiolongicarpus TaxID=13093 RepID=UPI00254D818D|nr:uncharacterized protein LOC130635989 isoform X1 [Hydractinia symbiolongicarpus]
MEEFPSMILNDDCSEYWYLDHEPNCFKNHCFKSPQVLFITFYCIHHSYSVSSFLINYIFFQKMESDGVLQLYQRLIENFGVRYNLFIGDGDVVLMQMWTEKGRMEHPFSLKKKNVLTTLRKEWVRICESWSRI